jgi:hypothetical protein
LVASGAAAEGEKLLPLPLMLADQSSRESVDEDTTIVKKARASARSETSETKQRIDGSMWNAVEPLL